MNDEDEETNEEIINNKSKAKLDATAKIISDFLITAEKDFEVKSYEDNNFRQCKAFDIKVEKYKLTIFCNDDGYIGFEIEECKK